MIKELLYSNSKRRIITRLVEIFLLGGITSLVYSQDLQLLVPMGIVAILEASVKAYREYLVAKKTRDENKSQDQ